MFKNLKKLGNDTRGLSFTEYLIILVVVAVAGITMWTTFGGTVEDKLKEQTDEVEGLDNRR